tara:strand:- start:1346 stop:2491 length:1146 start_codon:yes stop_codon:yes gene_type:complete
MKEEIPRFFESDKSKKNKIKLVIVGGGHIFQKHLKAILYHHEYFELKGICDNDCEKLKFIEEQLLFDLGFEQNKINKISFFKSYQELINHIKKDKFFVDIIILCTPSGLHVEEALEAANVGINVITEKPMALKLNDGIKMIRKFNKEKLNLFVIKQNRFNEALIILKKQIDAGNFGKISVVSINLFWHRSQNYYDKDFWRGTKILDGGALINQASHYVDLLLWLFGDVKSVFAQNSTMGRAIEVEDTSLVQFEWVNGTLGNMAITMLTYKENYEGSITIIGENGTVRIGGKALDKIDFWSFADQTSYKNDFQKIKQFKKNIPFQGHIPYYQSVIDFFKGSSKEVIDGKEGLKSLEFIEACYLSAKKAKQVKLPLYEKDDLN